MKLAAEAGFVHVLDERNTPVAFGPHDDLPDWAVRQMGPHVFEGGKHPTGDYPGAKKKPEPDSGDLDREPGAIPPKNGKGSGRDNWAAYANDVEVNIPAAATREEIIAAIDAAGKPTEYED